MSVISNAAVFTVSTYKLREEVDGALKALAARISRKYQDRQEMLGLLRTGDPMMDQAAEESDEVRDIDQVIADLRKEEGEMARLHQMLGLHSQGSIKVSLELFDTILELSNEVREVEAKGGVDTDVENEVLPEAGPFGLVDLADDLPNQYSELSETPLPHDLVPED